MSEKICSACRKSIDQAATVCPYCRSDSSYSFFVEIPDGLVVRERNDKKLAVWTLIILLVCAIVGITAFALAGFWIAAGAVIITVKIIYSITGPVYRDIVNFKCPGCGREDKYQWEPDSLDKGKPAVALQCTGCKQIGRIAVAA